MTPMEYQQRVLQTVVQLETDRDILGLCGLGLAGEMGEVVELLKPYLYDGQFPTMEKVRSEVGDILWYIAVLCSTLELPFWQILHEGTMVPYDGQRVILGAYLLDASVEVSKLSDLFKKFLYHHNGKSLDMNRVYGHLVMLLHFLSVLCAFLIGGTLEQAMEANIAKLEARHAQGFMPRYASDSHASE